MAQAVSEAPTIAAAESASGRVAIFDRSAVEPLPEVTRTLVVNADDFGRSSDINHAITLAHREGFLTSASLMVSGAAVEQAVELARRMPSLAVGLHLALADAPATLPARDIRHLADEHGNFVASPARAGLNYYLSRSARRELAAEIRAQFEQFAKTGLELSHVDGHCHLHLHPVVFDLLLPMAEEYGARAIRIVHDEIGPSLANQRRGLFRKLIWSAEFAMLAKRARHKMVDGRWPRIQRTIGLMQSGNMTEAYVLAALANLPGGVSEMYFHPSFGPQIDRFGPGPMDLSTLLSPALRQAIKARGIRLRTFPQVAAEQASMRHWQPGSGLLLSQR